MALLLNDDNNQPAQVQVRPANGGVFTLEEMQALVNGYIQCITTITGEVLVLNEEGKFNPEFAVNSAATAIGLASGIADTDYIVGPVILASRKEAGFTGDE